MGASVNAYWPGITEGQHRSEPGFTNDCKSWGNWMAEREGEPAVYEALGRLNAEALLTYKTDGMEDEEVSWVRPAQLRDAAARLREAVRAGATETGVIVETYARNCNSPANAAEEFVRDLDDIVAVADWAEREGAAVMTLEVNW
jgi:hypothetical protein